MIDGSLTEKLLKHWELDEALFGSGQNKDGYVRLKLGREQLVSGKKILRRSGGANLMNAKTKTPGGYPGASKTCHSRVARQAKYPTKTTLNQVNQVPVPGTVLSPDQRNHLAHCAAKLAELATDGVPRAAEMSREIMERLRRDRRLSI